MQGVLGSCARSASLTEVEVVLAVCCWEFNSMRVHVCVRSYVHVYTCTSTYSYINYYIIIIINELIIINNN
jgi:hypothetical protein